MVLCNLSTTTSSNTVNPSSVALNGPSTTAIVNGSNDNNNNTNSQHENAGEDLNPVTIYRYIHIFCEVKIRIFKYEILYSMNLK